ncbi:MAG: hypothetical protein NXY59_08170 [Aigarchaeota archaeon]|nr:hypothetical protein [Candidatus Pelearchaeum maunauluense]
MRSPEADESQDLRMPMKDYAGQNPHFSGSTILSIVLLFLFLAALLSGVPHCGHLRDSVFRYSQQCEQYLYPWLYELPPKPAYLHAFNAGI